MHSLHPQVRRYHQIIFSRRQKISRIIPQVEPGFSKPHHFLNSCDDFPLIHRHSILTHFPAYGWFLAPSPQHRRRGESISFTREHTPDNSMDFQLFLLRGGGGTFRRWCFISIRCFFISSFIFSFSFFSATLCINSSNSSGWRERRRGGR